MIASVDPLDASKEKYDFSIVGAGVVGTALAYGLATNGRKVLLLERDLSEPDRIVGELLQPGGRRALKQLGLLHVLQGIDAQTSRGYSVHWKNEEEVIPYPYDNQGVVEEKSEQWTGCGFHHGRLIQNLRKAAASHPNVSLVEATVTGFAESETGDAVVGVRAKPKALSGEVLTFTSTLSLAADGCFSSKFRKSLSPQGTEPVVASYFVGILLKETRLPHAEHAAIFLRHKNDPIDEAIPLEKTAARPVGPAVMYRISETETRVLVDFRTPKLPSLSSGVVQETLKRYPLNGLTPELRAAWNRALDESLDPEHPESRLRSMPNFIWPAYPQGRLKRGAFLVGDALNTRHPLTGGGMTVAFNDASLLSEVFSTKKSSPVDLNDWQAVSHELEIWHWRRKAIATTINTLASALYQLFSAPNPSLEALKLGCFNYFKLGGERKEAPASLASGVNSHPYLLIYHFFSVVVYSMYLMFHRESRPEAPLIPLAEFPKTAYNAAIALYTGCVVLLPVLFQEFKF